MLPRQMLGRKIALDLGTGTVLVHVRGEGVVVDEPCLAAVGGDGVRILALGRRACEMATREPDSIRLVRPVKAGTIADLPVASAIVEHVVGQIQGRQRIFRPEVMISVGSGVGGRERRALAEAAITAGARQAWLIDQALAAAIGAGLPVREAGGIAVCDIGQGSTEVAIIALSGMVTSHGAPVGGEDFDAAVAGYIALRHRLLVGRREAEEIKIAIGAAGPLAEPLMGEVRGRDSEGGGLRVVSVGSAELVDALQKPLAAILETVRRALVQTPPALAAGLADRGLVLTGGGALLPGIADHLSLGLGLPVRVADDPRRCVVEGTARALDQFEVLKRNQGHLL